MGNCISASGPHEANTWGAEPSFVRGSRKGLGKSSNSALLYQGSRDGVQLLLRRTSYASAHHSPRPPPLAIEPCTLCPNTSAGAREMLGCQPSPSSSCKPLIGVSCEESQVPKSSPHPSPRSPPPSKKASPRPLTIPLTDFPDRVCASTRRSSASTHGSPHQLHTQCQISLMRRGSLPLSPTSIVPPTVTSPLGPNDSRGRPLLHTAFPRDSALSVSISSPHTSMPQADASLTPSHSLCSYPTAHTFNPSAVPLNPANYSPAKSPQSAGFPRTLSHQPVSKPFILSCPGSPPLPAPNPTAHEAHQSSTTPECAALKPAHTEVQQQQQQQQQQQAYSFGAGKDSCRCEALGSGPTSAAMPQSPCTEMVSPRNILPSPFAQQWLAEAKAESLHGVSDGNESVGLPTEARDAFDDEGQQCNAQARSQGHPPLFVGSAVRHSSAGSYHWGLHSAQHSLCQQDMQGGGADDWASMHMAMAVAAELGENIPPFSMEAVAVIAEAEARASTTCQPLLRGNTNPGTRPGLKRNASTGSIQLASRSASSTLQADLSRSTSGAFAQAPLNAPSHAGLQHCCSDRTSPHSSTGGRHSAPSHQGSSTPSNTGSARTTLNSRISNCRSSSARCLPAATSPQLGNLATRPSVASSTLPHVADAVISLTHVLTKRSQRSSMDSTPVLGSDKQAAGDRGLKVLDTTPWTKDPYAATPSCTSSPRPPAPILRRPSFPLFSPGNKHRSPAGPHSDNLVPPQNSWRLGSPKALLRNSRSSCPSSGVANVSAPLPPSASDQVQDTPVVARIRADAPYTNGATPTSPLRDLKPPQHRSCARQNSLPPILQHSELRLGDGEGMHAPPPCMPSPRPSRPMPTSAPLFCRMSEGQCQQQQQRQVQPGGAGEAKMLAHAYPSGGFHGAGSRRALTHSRSVSQLLVGQPCSGGVMHGSSPPQSAARDEHELLALQGFFSPRTAAMKSSQSLARVPEALDHSSDSSGLDEVENTDFRSGSNKVAYL